jgi:hypothetical protein
MRFEMLWNRITFLVELTKTTGHKYCSLLTSVPDLGNFGTDPDHQICSPKNGSGFIQIFMDFGYKSYLFGGFEMQENSKNVSYPVKTLISSQIFCDKKFCEIKKLFCEIRNKYFAKFRRPVDLKLFFSSKPLHHNFIAFIFVIYFNIMIATGTSFSE